MQRSRSIVGIAVGVSSLVLVAAGMVAKRAIDQLAVTGDAVVAAKERELSFERLLSTLNDAETGQRGYLLSGSDEYLAPYEEALREVEGRSIGDAVIATDEKGLVTLSNPVAEKLTGWPLADARGRPLDQIFNIVNEQTRAAVESPAWRPPRSSQRRARQGQRVQRAAGPNNISGPILIANTIV
jgi:PAS domain S-box-containing protein